MKVLTFAKIVLILNTTNIQKVNTSVTIQNLSRLADMEPCIKANVCTLNLVY